MKRRRFIKNTALGTAALTTAPAFPVFGPHNGPSSNEMFIGTPVLPEYLYERGIADTLDAMQERSRNNAVMTFSHDHVFRQYERL